MPQYTVRSGQNIYDVALTLHGSVEGIFDLLTSNNGLTMETTLKSGMVLNYHDEFVVNKNIAMWLKDKDVIVRNGEHIHHYFDIDSIIKEHLQNCHKEKFDEINAMSPDEQNMYWEGICRPRMIIHQQGQLSTIVLKLKPNRHLIINWGDYSDPQIIDDAIEHEIEHCYKGLGTHIITLYGDFDFELLNFNELNGVYYPLGVVGADVFETQLDIDDINKLIVIQ